jgi:hypothetical protein
MINTAKMFQYIGGFPMTMFLLLSFCVGISGRSHMTGGPNYPLYYKAYPSASFFPTFRLVLEEKGN